MIGKFPSNMSNSYSFIFFLKNLALSCKTSSKSGFSIRISKAVIEALTIWGGNEFEKKYGLDLCLKSSIISACPVV